MKNQDFCFQTFTLPLGALVLVPFVYVRVLNWLVVHVRVLDRGL